MRSRPGQPRLCRSTHLAWIPAVVLQVCLVGQGRAQAPEPPPPAAAEPAVCLVLPLSGPHAGLGRRIEGAAEGALLAAGVSLPIRRYDTAGQVGQAAAAVLRFASVSLPDTIITPL